MFVITAPTSQIGSQLIGDLLAADAPVRVIARDPGRLAPEVRDRVEVVQGTHADPAVLTKALAEGDALFWLVAANPAATQRSEALAGFTQGVLPVIAGQGVSRIVGVSALGRGSAMAGRAGLVTESLAMDDLIASSGIAYRALACPSFMDNTKRQAAALREQGVLHGPIDPARTVRTCATRDIAATGARLLLGEGWTGFAEAPVLGPADTTYTEMVAVMSEVLGREVRYQQTSFDAYREQMLRAGMSEWMAANMTDMAAAKNDGLDDFQPRTAGTSTPTTFRQFCEETLKPLAV